MRDALSLSLLLACNSAAPPSPGSAPAASAGADGAAPAGPIELTAIAQQPSRLPDGTEIEVVSAGYAHTKDDRNLSDCRLEVRRAGQRETLSLERVDAPAPQVALGWRFTLDSVAAYNPPAKCTLTAERAP